jgi:ankyrin repeat protein
MKLLFVLLFFNLVSCGFHEQSIRTQQAQEEAKEVGEETDPTIRMVKLINDGDLKGLKGEVEGGGDINARNNEGLTLIMIAMKAQQFAIVEFLAQQGADLDRLTESADIDPAQNALEYLTGLGFDPEVEGIVLSILNKEEFDYQALGDNLFKALLFRNGSLLQWLLDKGADPNHPELSSNGAVRNTPLTYIFSFRGQKGEDLPPLRTVFEILVAHQGIDVNFRVRRNRTALFHARRRLEEQPGYQPFVDRLLALGAVE